MTRATWRRTARPKPHRWDRRRRDRQRDAIGDALARDWRRLTADGLELSDPELWRRGSVRAIR